MPSLVAAAAIAALVAVLSEAIRRVRRLGGEVALLSEQVRELTARLEVAERDAARAAAHAEVAEAVLVEKGVADEEDLEAARERSGAADAGYVRGRDGDLH